MGFEPDNGPNSTPKLSLYSLPISNPLEPPGLTPIRTLASIPFQWEEAPGKPRLCSTNQHHQQQPKSKTARCLELPPRLFNEAKVSNISSPTTVLDGPYLRESSMLRSRSLSFRKGTSSFSGLENLGRRSNKGRGIFGSSRWGSFRKKHKEVVGGSLDFFSSSASDCDGGDTKVNITRVSRKSSFLSFSSSSHLLTNIYGSIKQVAPWKRT